MLFQEASHAWHDGELRMQQSAGVVDKMDAIAGQSAII